MTVKSVTSIISGCLFAVAWWFWIDAHVYLDYGMSSEERDKTPTILFYYYIPGIVGTIGLLMANIISLDSLNPYSFLFDPDVGAKVKLWLFLSFIISFGAMAASFWIMAGIYMPPHNSGNQYPGIAIAVQNVLIFFCSLILLWGRSQPTNEDYQSI